jgi:hypothetical protein
MLIRWKETEDTPYRHVDAGTVAETEDDLAKRLIRDGIAEPVAKQAERAVGPKGQTATRK